MMKRITNSLMIVAVLALVFGFFSADALAQCEEGKCTDKSKCGSTCPVTGKSGDCTGKAKAGCCGTCGGGSDCTAKAKDCCGTCGGGSDCTAKSGDCSGDCGGCISCPFSQCVVSGKKFDGNSKPVVATYKGRQIYFYDEKCRAAFEANPEPYVKKYDQAMINVQSTMYPLDTCIVTGAKFSAEKPPVDYLYNNRLVRFCSTSQIAKFKENPAKYMAALDKAVVEQQTTSYPLDTCVVTGQKLGGMGEPVSHVWANQLVKFCCKGCIPQFNKDPRQYMVKVYAAMPHPGKDAGSTSTVAPAVKSKKDCGSDCGSKGSCPSSGSCKDKDSGTSTVVPAGKKDKSCGSKGSCGSSCGGKS